MLYFNKVNLIWPSIHVLLLSLHYVGRADPNGVQALRKRQTKHSFKYFIHLE